MIIRQYEEIKIGDVAKYKRTITEDDIEKFAEVSGDYNPVHINPEWAEKAKEVMGFAWTKGSTVAHGMMTMSFMASIVANWCYLHGGRIRKIESKFVKAVLPEDTIRCEGVVIEKHFIGEGKSFVTVNLKAINQIEETIAVGQAEVILP